MKLRKRHARLVLAALQGHKPTTPHDDVLKAHLIDRITDRFPSLTKTPHPRTRTRTTK